jgi:hypothetical protein
LADKIEVKDRRWVRCPVQNRYIYVEDCQDCPYMINIYVDSDGRKWVVCAFAW